MEKRSSATARIVAVTTLVLAAIIVIVAVGSSLGGGSGSGGHAVPGAAHRTARKKHVPASYEIQSGDTLVSIAHRMGVPVRQIEALNPGVDPQILIAGETIKLRETP